MTKNPVIFVILLVILVTLGFFVIFQVNDKTSTVMFVIHDKDDKTRVTKIVTMTKKDDKLSSMTEISDRDGFVTFRYIQRGEYDIKVELDSGQSCTFNTKLERRFYTIGITYGILPESLQCEMD